MQNALWKAIKDYLETITKENFSTKYRGLAQILIEYNNMGMGKDAIMTLWNEYYQWMHNSWSDWQDEVFLEISNCLVGCCTPHNLIHLKE